MINNAEIFSTNQRPSKELFIYECGYEQCKPRNPYQYEQIDYFLIHYILDGEGLFFINNKVYKLKKGDGFLIPPHTDNNYYPIPENPWTYRWIGINGTEVNKLIKLAGFDSKIYTFNYIEDSFIENCFKNILESCNRGTTFEALGNVYLFFSKLIEKNDKEHSIHLTPSENYISIAIDYIHDNYKENITVSHIAAHININRSHLFKIFKNKMNISPQQYLIDYRLNKACELLRKSSYSINEISLLTGFSSSSYFSKLFSKYKNKSPIDYRKMFIKN